MPVGCAFLAFSSGFLVQASHEFILKIIYYGHPRFLLLFTGVVVSAFRTFVCVRSKKPKLFNCSFFPNRFLPLSSSFLILASVPWGHVRAFIFL